MPKSVRRKHGWWTEGSDSQIGARRGTAAMDQAHFKVSMTQMALGTFGLGSGPFDGVLTPKTQHAIQAYQKIRGLSQTEGVDLITFKTLMDDFDEWRRPTLFPPSMEIAF